VGLPRDVIGVTAEFGQNLIILSRNNFHPERAGRVQVTFICTLALECSSPALQSLQRLVSDHFITTSYSRPWW
jgi:hypothetical protein